MKKTSNDIYITRDGVNAFLKQCLILFLIRRISEEKDERITHRLQTGVGGGGAKLGFKPIYRH